MIPTALVSVAAIVAVTVLSVITGQQHEKSNSSQHREPTYGAQVTLPFAGGVSGVAMDAAGSVYVADENRVVKLPVK